VLPDRAADHSPPSSAAVMEQYSYTSTHPLGHTGPVTGSLYIYPVLNLKTIFMHLKEMNIKPTGVDSKISNLSVK